MPNEPMDTASFGGDVEPLLPDGWDGVSDIFADAKEVNETIDEADEFRVDNELDGLLDEGEKEPETEPETDPTTVEEPEPEPVSAGPRTLKLKVNHEEKEINLNEMSDDDLIALFQKGYAFDAVKDRERRETYDRVYQEELDAGMTERQARYAAERESGGDYSKPAEEEKTAEPASPKASEAPAQRSMAEEIRQLQVIRPNVKSIPDDVTRMAANGIPLTQAYLAWESETNSKTAASLKKENEVLKHNAASAARAPVTGVTGGGATTGKPVSKFEQDLMKGFDSDIW